MDGKYCESKTVLSSKPMQMNNMKDHSVRLQKDKCEGCTNCIKRCPTEAIRVRDGKAKIMDERCIDCGECIRICPSHAKTAMTDNLMDISKYKYKIALPAPALYGQFKNLQSIEKVLSGLLYLGFDDVFEVARGADIVTQAVLKRLETTSVKPLISSACPAVLRLIQVRFPELIPNIVDVNSPMEVAATIAKREFAKKNGVDISEIGAFFITPCPAKMTSIKNPIGVEKSAVDGAISIIEIYGILSGQLRHPQMPDHPKTMASCYGVSWAKSGGESAALNEPSVLHVSGVFNIIAVLEEMEDDKLSDLAFFEGLACPGGCVGGALTFENGYVAQNRLRKLAGTLPKTTEYSEQNLKYADEYFCHAGEILPRAVMQLDSDITEAMRKFEQVELLCKRLPALDCGSCGSPTCRALAEDIVRGEAKEMDCIFILKNHVRHLAEQMVELASQENTWKK